MPVSASNIGSFHVGDWLVEPELDRITRNSGSKYLRPQVMELLVYFARHGGRVVSAEELLDDLWAGKIVTSSTVYNCIAELRQALADADDDQEYIETIPKRGYRLIAPVTTPDASSETLERRDGFAASVKAAPTAKIRNVILTAALVAGFLLISILAWQFQSPTVQPADQAVSDPVVRRFTINLPGNMRFLPNHFGPVVVSADGQRITFGAIVDGIPQLVSRSFDSLDVVPIKGTEYADRIHTSSPDGKWIAFIDERDMLLKKVPITGGVPITLCDPGGKIWDLAWGPAGKIAFTGDVYPGLMQVSSSGGTPEKLTVPDDGDVHKHAAFVPDGSAVLFAVGERGVTMRKKDRIEAQSLVSGERKSLALGASPQMTPSGHLIYFRDNAIWAVRFDAERLEMLGDSVPISDRVYYYQHAHLSFSDDGTLAYIIDTDLLPRSLVWVDRAGNEELLPIEPGPFSQPRIAPDGSRVAVVVDSTSGADLWIYSLDRGPPLRLTRDESREASPLWSRDGRYIYYSSQRIDNLFRVTTDGSNTIEQLTDSPHYQFAGAITPDDSQLLLAEETGTSEIYLSLLTVTGESTSNPLIRTEITSGYAPTISPDGRWFAYESSRSGQPLIYVRHHPLSFHVGARQIAIGEGMQPLWNPTGGELFYWGERHLMAVELTTGADLQARHPEPLFDHQDFVFMGLRNYDVSPDGERLLMVKGRSEYQKPSNRIVIVDSWLDYISRKVASN